MNFSVTKQNTAEVGFQLTVLQQYPKVKEDSKKDNNCFLITVIQTEYCLFIEDMAIINPLKSHNW